MEIESLAIEVLERVGIRRGQAVLDFEETMKRRKSSAFTMETSLIPPKNSAKKPTHLLVWAIVAGLRPSAWAWSS